MDMHTFYALYQVTKRQAKRFKVKDTRRVVEARRGKGFIALTNLRTPDGVLWVKRTNRMKGGTDTVTRARKATKATK